MRKAPILLIDPSAVTRSMYADCLRHYGYDVVEAEDAAEGLRLFARLDPALVVTELSDDPGWLDAIRMLRALVPGQRTPVILCSTRIDPFCPVLPAGIDADDALAKPVSPRELVARVDALLAAGGYGVATAGGVASRLSAIRRSSSAVGVPGSSVPLMMMDGVPSSPARRAVPASAATRWS